MNWKVNLHPAVEAWLVEVNATDPTTVLLITEAIDHLAEEGPTLGRPLVDRVKGSRHHNMKELRPASKGSSEVRMLFCFDPVRTAVFLVAGDKSGDWERWYGKAIPLADERYTEHLIALKEEEGR